VTTNLLIQLLAALATVESGNNPEAHGREGERGLYQFTAAAWKDCTDLRVKMGLPVYPFEGAHTQAFAREYAMTWLWHIESEIHYEQPRSQKVSVDAILSAWNCGLTRMRKIGYDHRRAPRTTRAFITRVFRQMGWIGPVLHTDKK